MPRAANEKWDWRSSRGRPKGAVSGRTKALLILDEVLNEAKVEEAIRNALRAAVLKSPLSFFKAIVMPLIPKENLLTMRTEDDDATKHQVRIIFSSEETERCVKK